MVIISTILVWMVPLVAIIIWMESKEKTFFKQERIGKNGKPFYIYKFKSMKGDCPVNDPLLSKDEASRITVFGKFLRKFRIDEFPQFFNVLKGEMSVVGPRPERQFFLDEMIKYIPKYREIQELKPGITSLGQIKYGYADNLDQMLNRARYDLIYLDNLSIWTDIKVIISTIGIVFQGKGK
ncbi:Sugar transferase involved in LPS biosynthesis (colanic, teichoic acid) [Lutibacter oricola]|uniref:Sugar transferase involved in LPS biosynthesis (Colanic, teichoic acid) n=2 Tax=Lutibacter oricola TaxID=762486 RepID=A0A1H3DEC3_9FLAO|nr:Sugar transferase involved in LPS biosynthesis (colanic, teichoic acid) [Lutibacter oricola]